MRLCLLFVLLLAVSCRKHVHPVVQPAGAPPPYIPLGLDVQAPMTVSPSLPVSPLLCIIQPGTLYCTASNPVRFRRGQVETPYPRGTVWHWDSPQGSGKALVIFGCEDAQPVCQAVPVFISSTVTATPSENARFVKGPESYVPGGSLGIVEVEVVNNAYYGITDRWSGAFAPPLLKAGPNAVVTCVADACTVSYMPPPASAPAKK